MKTSFFFPAVLHLTTQKLLLYLLAPALVAIVVQLAIGSSILVLMLVMVTVAAGFLGFAVLGIYNIGAWLALCYVLSNVLIALYAKTIMWQTLNSHLYSPLMSFAVLAVTTSSLFVALIIVRRIPVGGSLLTKTSNLHTLAWVSWGSFIIGIIAWVLNHHFDKPGGAGFGGLAVFIFIF
jgi:hypothetical protein